MLSLQQIGVAFKIHVKMPKKSTGKNLAKVPLNFSSLPGWTIFCFLVELEAQRRTMPPTNRQS
jgi:hypothetical protein